MSISKAEIENIPVSAIKPNPYQPRKQFSHNSLKELSQSIESYGILQPINVRKIGDGSYELVAGERRLRASKIAGLTEIPAIVVEFREKESAIIALMENLQRENLNYIEEASGYSNLIKDHGLTQKEIAERIGKSQSTIANKLRILNLDRDIQLKLLENDLSERHGRALLKLPTDEMRSEVTLQIIENGLNVKQTEELIDSILEDIIEAEKNVEVKHKKETRKKQSIKSLINTKIYLNTLKKAYKAIKDTGINADYEEIDKDDVVEVIVRIPKK